MPCSRSSTSSTGTTKTKCGSLFGAAVCFTFMRPPPVPSSRSRSRRVICCASRAARITGSISAATATSARFVSSRTSPGGRRITPTAVSTRATSRYAWAPRISPWEPLGPSPGISLGSTLENTRAILLDIEGTTTPIAFVHEVLFPYARARVRSYLERHATNPGVIEDLAMLRSEHGAESPAEPGLPPWNPTSEIRSAEAYVHWLMDRDRKSTGLKSLQGRIWEEGYYGGEL